MRWSTPSNPAYYIEDCRIYCPYFHAEQLLNLIDFSGEKSDEEEDPDIAKIKKVQSFSEVGFAVVTLNLYNLGNVRILFLLPFFSTKVN